MTRTRRVADESALTTFFRRHTELAKRVLKGASNLHYINTGLQRLIESIKAERGIANEELRRELLKLERVFRVVPRSIIHAPWRGETYSMICDDCSQPDHPLLHIELSLGDGGAEGGNNESLDLYFCRDGEAELHFFTFANEAPTESAQELMQNAFVGPWQVVQRKALAFREQFLLEIGVSEGGERK